MLLWKSKWLFVHNLDVVFSSLQSILGKDWVKDINKKKQCLWGFLIFHRLKSVLWIISGNMDAIIKFQGTVFLHLCNLF